MISKIINKVYRKIIKLIFQPIRVFCFHHVCEIYDENSMFLCDWISIGEFKEKINKLRDDGYQFISLTQANDHLRNDWVRRDKYAVVTFDDGYKSLLEVIPWLLNEKIPFVLFINGKYLDGVSYRDNNKEEYLDYNTLFNLTNPLIEIGHHGWEHTSVTNMNESDFMDSISKNLDILSIHPRYISFWAYTYGNHNKRYDDILYQENLVTVLMDGQKNYNNKKSIHRELI
jgi:peptidoglycan/xylan/chitin deacetylase (PgdA/CDA1 family)